MSKIEIQLGEKAFSFSDFQDWVNHAQESFYAHELDRYSSICIDRAGRLCLTGKDFKRAQTENTFPVDVYRV